MKYKRKKATFGVLAPNIQRGGMAIPLGNNLYWMKGRKHKTGGIDIGKDLEVENNEVMQMLPNETRVFSSVKMLGGNSPAELVASGVNPNMVFNAQEAYKRINRIRDDGSRYKIGGKAKLGKRIKGKTNDGSRDIYYDDKKQRWVWGKNRVVLPYGHRVKLSDGYEYQLNTDGTRTRIGKKPNAAEQAITAPMKYTPNNDIPTAALDVMTAPLADDDKLYYNGILPLHNPSIYKDAPLYAYRTGDMSYLRNDDSSIYTPVRRARQDLPRKLYEFYNQDTIYMPSSLIENVNRLKQGITINQENVDPAYVYGPNNKIAIDARNHNMQIRDLGNRNYVADFSDIFDTNNEFFDSKANPMIFSQFGVPVVFTDDESKVNQSFINEVNNALGKKYGGRKRKPNGGDTNIENDFVLNYLSQLQNNPIYRMNQIMTGNNMDLERQIENVRNAEEINKPIYNPRDGRYYGTDDPIRPAELNKNIYPKDLSSNYGTQGITSSKTREDRTLTGQNYIQYRSPLYYNDPQYNINEYGIDNEAIEAKQLIDHERTHAAANSPIEINTTPQEDMINFILGDEYYNTNPTYTKRPKEILAAIMALRGANNMTPQNRFVSIDRLYDDIQSNNVRGENYIIPEGSRKFLKQFTKEQLHRLFNEVAHNTNTNNMNLQNVVDNSLAKYGKRMISPNKLGTIIRVDGNGRDRLAYIPSTGSSKQDMKCGGRAKAPFGSSLSRLNSMLSKIDMDALSDAWDRVEEMEDEKYKNVKSNMIQLDDGTLIKESLPELDVSPKRDLFKFPTLNISSAPHTELRRPDFEIGNPIVPDDIRDKIKGLGDYNDYHWIKSGTDLLTTGLSTFNNLYYLNRMKEPPRPAVNPGVKLKTKWNNNATLSAIRESLANTITDLTRNTASSQNLRNSINQARANAIGLINKSNEDREKNETELINADLRQRATTMKDNIDNYNTWRNSLAAFRNNIFDKRSETWNNMMSNVNKVVNEAVENREQRDAERRQFDFLSYAYPIVRNNPAISNYLYDILFGKNNINIKSR